jgi:hypothetical protein
MPTDHDRLISIEGTIKEICGDMEEIKPRVRAVEDSILQAKTAVTFAKAIFGLVSIDIIIQLCVALKII